jgi:hypothetical protein
MSTPTATRESAPAPPPPREHERGGPHWESWLLRALLAGLVVYQLLNGNRNGAQVAGMGLALAFIPPLITRFSRWHVPRPLELTFVLAMFLQFASESLKLFELFPYWDKIVHPTEIFLATGVSTYLLLGYRKRHNLDIPDGLAALGAMLFGMTLGASWELVEFALDWFGNANLQKSNADTMTDILTNDAGAIFGALLAFWWYRHRTSERQKEEFGAIADWLTGRLSRLFTEHGFLVGVIVAAAIGGLVLAGWLMDRAPVPPPPPVRGQLQPQSWDFSAGTNGATAVVRGDWLPGERGLCRVNLDDPPPGSEQMGVLALAPETTYGEGAGFTMRARAYTERPALGAGTAMATGLVFGLRDADDYYLLRLDATHDTLALLRHLHGHDREVREVRLRTRGNEWHEVALTVQGDRVAAAVDGRPAFEEPDLADTSGGVGLWARVTSAGCFRDARVEPQSTSAGVAAPNTAAGAPAA